MEIHSLGQVSLWWLGVSEGMRKGTEQQAESLALSHSQCLKGHLFLQWLLGLCETEIQRSNPSDGEKYSTQGSLRRVEVMSAGS